MNAIPVPMRTWLVLTAGLCISALAPAAPPAPAAVEELMRSSGTWQQLADIQREIDQGLDRAAASAASSNPQNIAALHHAFAVAYSPDRLRPIVARELAKALSAEDVDAALAWFATDDGKRIAKLEEDASGEGPSRQRRDRAQEIVAAIAPASLAQYQRIARATHASEVAATVMIDMSYGLAHGIRLAMPGAPTQDPDALRATMQAGRARIVALMEVQQIAFSADAYRTLSAAELDRYLAFVESPVGRRFQAATMIAVDIALTDSATEAGRLFAIGRAT